MLPPITIVMTTWAPNDEVGRHRKSYAELAMASWITNLSYDGELRIHVADDGSELPGFPGCLADVYADAIPRVPQRWAPALSLGSPTKRRGLGGSLNAGLSAAFQVSPLVAYFADDWSLTAPFDLTPWATLMQHGAGKCGVGNSEIGVIRLLPHPDLTGTVLHLGELGWALKLDRHHFVCGVRPALYHERFVAAYGWFEEVVNVFECEQSHNNRFCGATEGPDIVLALPHPWEHIGHVEVNAVLPKGDR